jgi:hypothetical protein
MLKMIRRLNTQCGQSAEIFNVTEVGTTVLLTEAAFSQGHFASFEAAGCTT